MPYIIHVPQGRAGRFEKATLSYDLSGLYTWGFTSCNIVAFIGKERFSLIHFDANSHINYVRDEYRWVGEPCEKLIIIREQGKILSAEILKALAGIKFSTKNMDDAHDGVYISFKESGQTDIHPQIKKYPISQHPANLLCHPDEQKFLAVQKIEQIIGKRAKQEQQSFKVKQHVIFDSRGWEVIPEWELSVDCSHALTREEMKFFGANDDFVTISSKLLGIIAEVSKTVPLSSDSKTMAMSVAVHLEDYLNKFDYVTIFKRDIKEIFLSSQSYQPENGQDEECKAKALQALQQNGDCFLLMDKIMEGYRTTAPDTRFKQDTLDCYALRAKNYQDRKAYFDLMEQNRKRLEQALQLSKAATARYQASEYKAAANLFLSVLKTIAHVARKDNPYMATTYYNIGRSLYKNGEYQTAEFFLDAAITLTKAYDRRAAQIEKVTNAWQECKEKLAEQQSSLSSKTFSSTTTTTAAV